MKMSSVFASIAMTLLTAGLLFASDEKKPANDKPAPAGPAAPMMIPIPQIKLPGVEWSDEQKDKIKELQKEMLPKFMESAKKMEDLLTDEQKKARKEAVDAAKAAGKAPKEIMDAVRSAVTLTDDQKKQAAEIQKDMRAAQQEFVQKVLSLLTPEQKQQFMEKQNAMRAEKSGEKAEKPEEKKEDK